MLNFSKEKITVQARYLLKPTSHGPKILPNRSTHYFQVGTLTDSNRESQYQVPPIDIIQKAEKRTSIPLKVPGQLNGTSLLIPQEISFPISGITRIFQIVEVVRWHQRNTV